ncbi:hypothetical protein Strain138_001309 [Pseudogemmatithrix spongiicola]|uniref:Uncharacterized protein n=1 Tax=Pseudogemmatithrix spongiicola TaxID=3062599 RepID=A0AA49JZS0_9BACT|nr:hypothetical protein Strain138_001309 [Gemmatimonadaceae bacterium 'strain 138']WKW14946.1 hypothetical protein Strain318_001309 [Gemmatimonadaceae bacterium 'strain 318']
MYSTCTFCHAPLGRNEALEHFPVGGRVAFDQARGRLWAVCPNCRQWNLSPLETRWEAIEEGERLYRDTKLRVATDHIGLAKLRDGTELIRIGEPLRPEFAAWRYGERFTRRYRKAWMIGVGGVAVAGGWLLAGPALGIAFGSISTLPLNAYTTIKGAYDDRKVVVRHEDDTGPFMVTRSQVRATRIVRDASSALGWSIEVQGRPGVPDARGLGPSRTLLGKDGARDAPRIIDGPAALQAMRAILPEVNRNGGRSATVAEAVKALEAIGGPERMFLDGLKPSSLSKQPGRSWELGETDAHLRLALEMAAHEETERRALEGELAALEAVWREAEEIAAIADGLTLPTRVALRLERLLKDR